ncbi:hypothetical protein ACNF42_07870 [Cuniculiplasma sp. SKW3]|uniref:hypothetical protein n=1 Tax=Cuniculiplasma sp. SKW3 TaxID=3400170 RepID=UPI003FCF5D02
MKNGSTKPKIIWIGFISNCDDSILMYQLGDGLTIKPLDHETGFDLLKKLSKSCDDADFVSRYATSGLIGDSSKPLYVITKEVNSEISVRISPDQAEIKLSHEDSLNLMSEASTLSNLVQDKLRLLRLFKEGNICMPVEFMYVDTNEPIRLYSMRVYNIVQREIYHLDKSEVDSLSKFLREVSLPFTELPLNMAFSSFELSYTVNFENLSFVSCITGLECLLSEDSSEISYKISRNMAILLGRDEESSKDVFNKVKKLYSNRSKIVHGVNFRISRDDLKDARYFLREAIKSYIRAGLTKTALLRELNSLRYKDERRWLS